MQRLQAFGLATHPEKSRLIRFGRYAMSQRAARGEGKPETFDFLGFTHACGKTRKEGFKVIRQTMAKRMRAKLKAIKLELRRRLHHPIPEVGKWLRSVLRGYYRYHAVPGNSYRMKTFHYQISRLWFRALLRRSQRTTMTWERMKRLIRSWLPYPRVLHPYPERRLRV